MSLSGRVAAVVVNHDGGEDILGCLASLRERAPGITLVVVDNASSDGSAEAVLDAFEEVVLVRNATNVGFGPAANQGVAACSEPFVFVVNPDAEVGEEAVARLVETLESHPRAAAVGALVLNPDGSVQPSKRAFPPLWAAALHGLVGLIWADNPGTRRYLLSDVDTSAPTPVDWVSGSAVALRREAFEAVDGFDPDYFFFVEDVDLCKRLRDAGWEIWFEPRAPVVHAWGGSWTKRPLRFLWMHHRNLFRYVTKHRRGAWVLLYPAVLAGLGLRFTLLALRWLVARRSVPAHRGSAGRRPPNGKEAR